MQVDPKGITRPIIGIENRTAVEVFDIMCDRFLAYLSAAGGEAEPVAWRWTTWPYADIDGDEWSWTLTEVESSIPSYATVQPLYLHPQHEPAAVEPAEARAAALEEAAEAADVAADEQDVLALSADESNFAAYRQGERVAKEIATAIRALTTKEAR